MDRRSQIRSVRTTWEWNTAYDQGVGKAIKAFRKRTRPAPDGAIIAPLAYIYQSSPENDNAFPEPQPFVAGDPVNIQFSVKDLKKYADTGGWAYGQFENGVAIPASR